MLQLLVAVKQCHENGVCHGKSCFNWNPTLEMHFLHWCYKLFAFLLLFKVISSVRMCWLLPPIGFTLLTLHLSNPLTFHMMTPLISLFSLTLVDEDSVILHLRFVLFPSYMSILFVLWYFLFQMLLTSSLSFFHSFFVWGCGMSEILWTWRGDAGGTRYPLKTLYGYIRCRVSIFFCKILNLEEGVLVF